MKAIASPGGEGDPRDFSLARDIQGFARRKGCDFNGRIEDPAPPRRQPQTGTWRRRRLAPHRPLGPAECTPIVAARSEEMEHLSVTLTEMTWSKTDRLSIADLIEALGERSFGSLLLAMALPATLLPPVASAALGAPLLIVSVQLLFRRRRPALPAALARISLSRRRANLVLIRTAAMIARLEGALKPRLGRLLAPWHAGLVAACCGLLSIVLMLPTPIAHTAAGLGIGAFAAGLMQRDGLALLAGWALAVCCALILALLLCGALLGFHWI